MSEIPISRYDHYRAAKSFESNGQYDEALNEYAKAIEISSDYVHAWFYKSRLHHRLRQYKEAKSCAERALELAPAWEKHIRPIIHDCNCQE